MKIHGYRKLGSSRRLAIYLEEKGIEIPFVPVNLMEGEHRTPDFLARNPAGLIPVLELDDGTCIGETVAIARYLEELHPDPPFMGRDPLERARLEMWQRVVEFGVYTQLRAYVRQTSAFAKPLEPVQMPEWGELNKRYAMDSLRMLDAQLANNPFVAGPDFSWADITLATCIQGGRPSNPFELPGTCEHLARWYDQVSRRPSLVATQPD
ncbi:glutathione S-transferase family protein [Myxococcota bacterium]|nr:glutathione S-transferase family protein [Myxococcota bacterium]